MTRDEDHTRRCFGGIETIPTVAFPWPPVERARRLREVRDAVAGADPVGELRSRGFGSLVEGLMGCDAVHIAGGGNLNSTYGWLLSERAAVALIANSLGKPVTMAGQTIGPAITAHDAADLGGALVGARAVGLRDAGSVLLARELLAGTPAAGLPTRVLDDATFLESEADAETVGEEAPPRGVVVTLSGDALAPFRDRAEGVVAWAGLLDEVAAATGLGVVFVPHMATPGEGDGDEEVHALVSTAMRTPTTEVRPISDARATRRIVGAAALVISTRFHPIVFALAQGRPAIGVCATGYAFARVQGVFENWGMSGFALPIDGILDPAVAGGIAAVADDRAVTEHLGRLLPERRRFAEEWWDHLFAAMSGGRADAPVLPGAPTLEAPAALAVVARRLRLFARRAMAAESTWVDLDRAASEAAVGAAELAALRSSRTFRALARLASIRRKVTRGR